MVRPQNAPLIRVMDILETAKNLVFIIVIFSICVCLVRAAINIFFKKDYAGKILVGRDQKSGKKIYRIEISIPFDELDEANDILLKVEKTEQNLGINETLYDLEDEGIGRDPYKNK